MYSRIRKQNTDPNAQSVEAKSRREKRNTPWASAVLTPSCHCPLAEADWNWEARDDASSPRRDFLSTIHSDVVRQSSSERSSPNLMLPPAPRSMEMPVWRQYSSNERSDPDLMSPPS